LVAISSLALAPTAAVAERLGRKWIASDLGKFAIHTTRKRMIGVQRRLKAEGHDYRAFEILNLGRYERQHYIGVNPNLREAEQQRQLEEKEAAFLALILRAYHAEAVEGFRTFDGKKAGRLVAVGPVNLPVTRLYVEEIILECREKHITRVDILGFEFERGCSPTSSTRPAPGHRHRPQVHPGRGVRQARRGSAISGFSPTWPYRGPRTHLRKNSVAVELTDFSVSYSQDSVRQRRSHPQEQGQQDRGGKRPDREGEQGRRRHRHTRDTHSELDRLDRLLGGGFQL
jgi:hypothetical protein